MPLNEAQVRPLIGLNPEDQVKAGGRPLRGPLARVSPQSSSVTPRTFRGYEAKAPEQSLAPKGVGFGYHPRKPADSALSALAEKDLGRAQATLEATGIAQRCAITS